MGDETPRTRRRGGAHPLAAVHVLTAAVLLAVPVLAGVAPLATGFHAMDGQAPCIVPERLCPDLVGVDRPLFPQWSDEHFDEGDCAVEEGLVEAGDRRLLRFRLVAPNLGDADVFVGQPPLHPEWYELAPCHAHFHFEDFVAYRFWTRDGFETWDELRREDPDALPSEVLDAHPDLADELVRGHKQGFCLADIRAYDSSQPQKYLACTVQGISVGWADVYVHQTEGQWIDTTGLPDGDYVLETELNPARIIDESDHHNNRAWVHVTIEDEV